ncbi:hypothetical protein [Flavihumibacter sp. CACIAM 22H1]|uniref:hypothetical protein n=1 Tax=Flavihumibacter sp. CACIAM 22H1 TaxID=1812911 RepID=UPI0007A8245A|nr:hypothetical protein [Flavihumibacter sp. CACIAM 22H1]KYP13863.1 MAG: hypothetical protein A1D16_14700 [Flavihumibacter sp. CACIAM 22H1]
MGNSISEEQFLTSLEQKSMPAGLTVYQQALWQEGQGNWEKAHELIQDLPDKKAALLHAYLHRVEGDQWNADYWYRKAGEQMPSCSLQEEWSLLVKRFSV